MIARLFALLTGLPTLPRLDIDSRTEQEFERFTAAEVDPAGAMPLLEPPGDTLTYLRWLVEHRPVLFHGSRRSDLAELRPDRESQDVSEFGNQRAVFASDDPPWCMWFALLQRGSEFRSTRNGVWRIGRNRRHAQYLFSVNAGVADHDLLAEGWMYVLPRAGFVEGPPLGRFLRTGEWANPEPVRPIAVLRVRPRDFPFRNRIGRHGQDESMAHTILRARHR